MRGAAGGAWLELCPPACGCQLPHRTGHGRGGSRPQVPCNACMGHLTGITLDRNHTCMEGFLIAW
eukprot:366116-Chlamydomonas_euryale.AAC.7